MNCNLQCVIYLWFYLVFCYELDVYVECFKFLMQYDIYDAAYEDRNAAPGFETEPVFRGKGKPMACFTIKSNSP